MKNKKKKVNPRENKTSKDRRHKNKFDWSWYSKAKRKKLANKKSRKGPYTRNAEYKKLYQVVWNVF